MYADSNIYQSVTDACSFPMLSIIVCRQQQDVLTASTSETAPGQTIEMALEHVMGQVRVLSHVSIHSTCVSGCCQLRRFAHSHSDATGVFRNAFHEIFR